MVQYDTFFLESTVDGIIPTLRHCLSREGLGVAFKFLAVYFNTPFSSFFTKAPVDTDSYTPKTSDDFWTVDP